MTLQRRPDHDKGVSLDVLLRHLGGVFGNPLPPGVTFDKLLRSLDGTIPADVEHGVRVALTRRGVLAVAADATE